MIVISYAKNGKSFGIDMLPNEVFSNANSDLLIHNLFKKCFENGILPDEWRKSVIKPIPKNKKNVPRLPITYQEISFMPTMCKLFSMLLNNILSNVLESRELICDKQNDVKKALDKTDRSMLLSKLLVEGSRGNFL